MKLKIYYFMFYLYYLLTIFNPCNQIHQCHKSFSYHLFTNLQPKSKEIRLLYNTIVTKKYEICLLHYSKANRKTSKSCTLNSADRNKQKR